VIRLLLRLVSEYGLLGIGELLCLCWLKWISCRCLVSGSVCLFYMLRFVLSELSSISGRFLFLMM